MSEEHLFDEIKRYVGFDAARLVAVGPVCAPHFASIADDYYANILRHEEARQAITGGDAQVERLKGTLRLWLAGLFEGTYELEYYEVRARIGRRHVQIGLPQQYMFTAMNVIRRHLQRIVFEALGAEAVASLASIDKLLDMELAIMLHTYREDYLSQVQRTERLAAIGQLAGSIGHELRNPLGVIRSSVYLLRGRIGDDEKAKKHLDKIDGQIGLSNRIVTDLLETMRDRPATRRPVAPETILDAARELTVVADGSSIELTPAPRMPDVLVDPDQVRQIFVNLLQNGVEAAGPSGRVLVSLEATSAGVEIRVSDSGPGFTQEARVRLFEPLFTTKSRGIGLGLALCRRLAERNGVRLQIEPSGPLSGASFLVILPVT